MVFSSDEHLPCLKTAACLIELSHWLARSGAGPSETQKHAAPTHLKTQSSEGKTIQDSCSTLATEYNYIPNTL